ncbi:MAG TPA: HXXEE domain-containing protein, partial [Terriglobales bacterium]|nr:HXXEE domain-containing protein [Terriglobales bacterium]
MNLKYFAILMYATLIAHQIEEYIGEFWKVFPLYVMPKDVFIIINVAVSIFLLPVWIFLWQNKSWAVNIALAFSTLMVVNGILHIGWSICLHRYMPGLITGIIFILIFAFS